MSRMRLVGFLIVALIFAPIVTLHADEKPGRFKRRPFSSFFRTKPKKETAVIRLAKTIDELEKKLNQHGTVVAKAPDIWGEARLTKHRQEFERELAKEVGKFDFRFNAAIARSDQAFLASAFSISRIGQGYDPSAGPQTLTVNQATSGLPAGGGGRGDDAAATVVVSATNPRGLIDSRFRIANPQISIEPQIRLDQQARYLNHLHQLRRLNEGDDTSDSPGYSMNLVRIPVSIMPGSMTRRNHGAEITVTATPHVTDQLLPVTFRQLVINDLVDVLSPVIRKLAEELPRLDQPLEEQPGVQRLAEFLTGQSNRYGPLVLQYYGERGIAADPNGMSSGMFRVASKIQRRLQSPRGVQPHGAGGQIDRRRNAAQDLLEELQNRRAQPQPLIQDIATPQSELQRAMADLGQNVYALAGQVLHSGVGSVTRRSREPVPSSQVPFVFGVHELISLSYDLRERTERGRVIHLTDVRSYLHDELEAAYDMVSDPEAAWMFNSDPDLIHRIRNPSHANAWALFNARVAVTNQFSRKMELTLSHGRESFHLPSVTTSLAWAVIAESVLLNQQLNKDTERVSRDPGCECIYPGPMVFHGPNPSPQARRIFCNYVKCRWPVHVFALDPQAQDQNIADSYSSRREMQLALALAFANGEISAQKMTRYIRRLETDIETIALNRTAAAFGHGRDVFGWRFYPRVQTPPFEGNGKVIVRELLKGSAGKDELRRSWEIEPGMRECTAVVLMPSFITHMEFDIRGNYFPLGRHKFKEPSDTRTSIEDNMKMSHKIKLIQDAACCVHSEATEYRSGEMRRLLRRADQLARKLPLQTVHARVPNENTLGGFEIFSSGISDLAPELLDFYGQPGVNPETDNVFYLVGNNFSVHDTRVLAGNRNVEFALISRQVMQVTIPAGVQTVNKFKCVTPTRCEQPRQIVDVHVATPYGVSQHLEIPVISDRQPTAGYRWTRNLKAVYRKRTAPAKAVISLPRPFQISIAVPSAEVPHPPQAKVNLVITIPALGLSVARPTAAFDAVLNRGRTAYVIAGADFVSMQEAIRDQVIGLVDELRPGGTDPLKVHVAAAITPEGMTAAGVSNELLLTIRIEESTTPVPASPSGESE